MQRFIVIFSGHVQGVGFRMTCVSEAAGMNIHGHVQNQSDGTVRLDIDAAIRDGNELIRRIKIARAGYLEHALVETGPSLNRVAGFSIRH